jgi:hypothetical protein
MRQLNARLSDWRRLVGHRSSIATEETTMTATTSNNSDDWTDEDWKAHDAAFNRLCKPAADKSPEIWIGSAGKLL